MATVEELTQELQQARMMLEVEKQRTRQLQDEVERLRRSSTGGLMSGPALGTLGSAPPLAPLTAAGARPGLAAPSQGSNRGTEGAAAVEAPMAFEEFGTDAELLELRKSLEKVTADKHEVEQRKWTIDKENIALKEQLNKLKVQGQNTMKLIEESVEKSDRKENQNFKTRLEITDLRKALSLTKAEREKQEETNTRLLHEVQSLEADILHYRALVDRDQQRKDIISAELNRQQDILGQYQSGFLARFYDK